MVKVQVTENMKTSPRIQSNCSIVISSSFAIQIVWESVPETAEETVSRNADG